LPEDENIFEKRLNDLEVAVAEIMEKVEGLDIVSLSNFQEKMEEIEDLIMVEQAGILELKKMIYEPKVMGTEATEVATNVEERLKKVEHDVASILEKKEEIRTTGGIEVEEIYKRIDELKRDINNMKGVTEELKRILEEKMRAGAEVGTRQGAGFISPRVAKIEEKVKLLEKDLREGMLQKFSDVAKEKEVATTSMRLNDIEKMIKMVEESNRKLSSSLSSDINTFKKKVEALEAEYTNLSKQMEGRPEDFAKTEEKYRKELEDLKLKISRNIKESEASNTMDTQINELLEKIASLEGKLKTMEKTLSEVSKDRPFILE